MEKVTAEIVVQDGQLFRRAVSGDRYVLSVLVADCLVDLFFHPNMLKIENGRAMIDLTPNEPNAPLDWSAE